MIKIIGVGAIKEEYIRQGIDQARQGVHKQIHIEIIEVADEKAPEHLSDKEKREVKRKEGEKILRNIQAQDYVVALTLDGKIFKEKTFGQLIQKEKICFVIGGSLGLSQEVCRRANQTLSFGPMTYPHQLMRWVLIEKIGTCL